MHQIRYPNAELAKWVRSHLYGQGRTSFRRRLTAYINEQEDQPLSYKFREGEAACFVGHAGTREAHHYLPYQNEWCGAPVYDWFLEAVADSPGISEPPVRESAALREHRRKTRENFNRPRRPWDAAQVRRALYQEKERMREQFPPGTELETWPYVDYPDGKRKWFPVVRWRV